MIVANRAIARATPITVNYIHNGPDGRDEAVTTRQKGIMALAETGVPSTMPTTAASTPSGPYHPQDLPARGPAEPLRPELPVPPHDAHFPRVDHGDQGVRHDHPEFGGENFPQRDAVGLHQCTAAALNASACATRLAFRTLS
jgi:hypothetical protein